MFTLVLWNQILEQFHKTGKYHKTLRNCYCSKLYAYLSDFIQETRNNFSKTEYIKEKLSGTDWKNTKEGLQEYRLTEIKWTLTIFSHNRQIYIKFSHSCHNLQINVKKKRCIV